MQTYTRYNFSNGSIFKLSRENLLGWSWWIIVAEKWCSICARHGFRWTSDVTFYMYRQIWPKYIFIKLSYKRFGCSCQSMELYFFVLDIFKRNTYCIIILNRKLSLLILCFRCPTQQITPICRLLSLILVSLLMWKFLFKIKTSQQHFIANILKLAIFKTYLIVGVISW